MLTLPVVEEIVRLLPVLCSQAAGTLAITCHRDSMLARRVDLPLIMGATMLIQQNLNPAPLDPIQAKVMMVLPVVFTVFFAFFPAGLVLYWVVNNTLSIAQQYVITKRVEKGAA